MPKNTESMWQKVGYKKQKKNFTHRYFKMIKQCPLESRYKFKTKCRVTTCKNYTETTENNCLGLDVVFSEEISTVELKHYKFQDKSIKDIEKLRKKSIERVRNMVSLFFAIQHIREKYKPFEMPLNDNLENLLDHVVLKNKILNFEPWLLRYIFVDSFMESITSKKFSLAQLLGFTPTVYNFYKNQVIEQYNIHQIRGNKI